MAVKPSLESSVAGVASLVPLGPNAGTAPLKLKKAVIVVGSAEQCHLRLLSSTVSKQHALIVNAPEGVYIRDLASRTKVFIDDHEQRESALSDGDEIRIGRFVFKFTAAAAPPAGTLPSALAATLEVDGKPIPGLGDGRTLLIGRMAGCDLRFTDESISTRHAVIFQAGGRRFIRDLNSRSGTFLNGARIHQEEIKFGDQVRIGKSMVVLAPAAAPPQPAAAEAPLGFQAVPAQPAEQELPPQAPPIPAIEADVSLPLPVEPFPEPVAATESFADRVEIAVDPALADLSGDTRIEEFVENADQWAVPHDDQTIPAADVDQNPINFEPASLKQQPPAAADADENIDLTEIERPRRGWHSDAWRQESDVPAPHAQTAPSIPDLPAEPVIDLVSPEPETAATIDITAVEPPGTTAAAEQISAPIVELPPPAQGQELPDDLPAEPVIDLVSPGPEPVATIELASVKPPDTSASTESISAPVVELPPAQGQELSADLPHEPVIDRVSPEPETAATIDIAAVEPPDISASAEPISAPIVELPPPVQEQELPADLPAEPVINFAPPEPETAATIDIAAVEPPDTPAPAEQIFSAPIIELPSPAGEQEPPAEPAEQPSAKIRRIRSSKLKTPSIKPKAPRTRAKRVPPQKIAEEPVADSALAPDVEVDFSKLEINLSPSVETGIEQTLSAVYSSEPSPLVESDAPVSASRAEGLRPPEEIALEPVSDSPSLPEPAVDISQSETDPSLPVEAAAEQTPSAVPAHKPIPRVDLSSFSAAAEDPSVHPPMESEAPAHALHGDVLHPAEESEIFDGFEQSAPPPEQPIAGLRINADDFAPPLPRQFSHEPPAVPEETKPFKELTLDLALPPLAADSTLEHAASPPLTETTGVAASSPPAPPTADQIPQDSPAPPEQTQLSGELALHAALPGPAEQYESSPPIVVPPTQWNLTASDFSSAVDSTVEQVAPPAPLTATTDLATQELPAPAAPSPLPLEPAAPRTQTIPSGESSPSPPSPPAAKPPASSLPAGLMQNTGWNLTAPAFAVTSDSTMKQAAPTAGAAPPAPPHPAMPMLIAPPLSSLGGTALFDAASVDLDHFLGGMPLRLEALRPPPPGFGKVVPRFDARPPAAQPEMAAAPTLTAAPAAVAAPAVAAAPPSAAAPPDAAPAAATTPPPIMAKAPTPKAPAPKLPTKAVAPAVPFATDPVGISADNLLNLPPSHPAAAHGGSVKPAARNVPRAFEGLAMPTVREADVFSAFEGVSLNDTVFGGAQVSPPEDYAVPEIPRAAARRRQGPQRDFADDEFWNRTDEQEGLAPMGVPRRPAEPPPSDAEPPPEDVAMPSPSADLDVQDDPPAPHPVMVAPAPPRKKRRWLRIPFLIPAMALTMGAALAAIWTFVPRPLQISGRVTFLNFAPTPGTADAADFEATQRRLLADDRTRQKAREFLGRNHPDAEDGFLAIPELFNQTASTLSLIPNRQTNATAVQLTNQGTNQVGDVYRMSALLQSLIAANGPAVETSRQHHGELQDAQGVLSAASQRLDDINRQLNALQPSNDQQSVDDLTKAAAAKMAQQQEAQEAVKADQALVARLQAAPASAATQPADLHLKQMRQQLADLTAELAVARSDQATGAAQARKQLEDAVGQFNDQLASAASLLNGGSQLKQFVDSARDAQQKARELIDMLLVDGEDLEKQLEDTRRDIEDFIEARQRERWAADPQLQQLQASLDSAQHGYNANVGQGVNDPRVLDPLQKEIDDYTAKIKARQTQLGIDPSEVKVEDGLTRVIHSLRNKLDKEKIQIDLVLNPLQKQLTDLNPVVSALPGAQQDLVRHLHEHLDALNDARRRYADAIGQGQITPSAKVSDLQKQIDDLKAGIDRRQSELAQQTGDLPAARAKLAADQQNLQVANKASEEAQAAYNAAASRVADLTRLTNQKTRAVAELKDDQRIYDEKAAQSGPLYELKPFNEKEDITVSAAAVDPRWNYSAYAIIALAVLFAALAAVPRFSSPIETARLQSALPDRSRDEMSDEDQEPLTA